MKASDLLVKCLEAEGVEYIWGVPGEENLDFLESLKGSNIELIVTRHEQAAGFIAATYGRLTGKPGVCLSTLGPGATNFVTAAAYAQLGGMPMLMITGQKPINKSKQGRFQIIDVVGMMKPITKFTRQVTHGDRIPATVREAFKIAMEEKPGAVHIEIPEDVAAEETSTKPMPVDKVRRPDANEKAIDLALEMLYEAKRPLVLVGAGANRAQVSKMLAKFLGKTELYFFNTQMGKGVVPDRSDQYIGTAALSAGDYVHCAVDRADLIINIGHDVIEKPPFFMEQDGDQKVIHLNYNSAEIDEVYFPQLEVVGDVANALWQLTEKIDMDKTNWDLSYFQKVADVVREKVQEKADAPNFPMYPQRYVSDIRKVMGKEDIICLDNGMYKLWFARNYRAYAPNTVLLDNALATMGAGMPSAMAAKMVHPDKRVLAICGDGGFMMNSQDLETAVRMKQDLVVVILNNSNYGMIKWKQAADNFADYGLDFGNPDFVKYAQSYGAYGHRVESADGFAPLLEKCFNDGGVHLIDLPIDDSQHAIVLTEELANKRCVV